MKMKNGLYIRKLAAGDYGLCAGIGEVALRAPLFRVASIDEMIEVLRQLSNQAVQLRDSQFEKGELG